ncbi:MAG TPA: hypothetical protein VJ572_02950 [Azonexus sp.]|nr:hypothetical protein [Azonexus sp.]
MSWQIVPATLDDMMCDADHRKSGRVMTALLNMKKLNIAAQQQAYDG